MKRFFLAVILSTITSINCFASVCILTGRQGSSDPKFLELTCDGKGVSLLNDTTQAEDNLTAELNNLLGQGYKIVTNSGGNFYGNFQLVYTLVK